MKITRKQFLSAGGGSLVLIAARKLTSGPEASAAQPADPRALKAKRWAMVLDQVKCGRKPECTKCLEACSHAHNVPAIPDKARRVQWIWKERFEDVFPTTQGSFQNERLRGTPAVVMCNHCEQPPCVRVCPTGATWKREDGIVMMDWHRCIGCRYCVAACPYGSRSFNWSDPRQYIPVLNADFPTRTRGVVEKCNFCEERLAKGEPPACVEACPEKALAFGDIEDPNSPVRQWLRERYGIRRKPELGTGPQVFYLL